MKKRMIAAAAGVLAFLGISLVYAGFSDRLVVTNRISTGDVNIRLEEFMEAGRKEKPYEMPDAVMPGDEISKIPRITNLAAPCWIRAKVTFSDNRDDVEGLSENMLSGISQKWIRRGSYYYYTSILKKGESTDFFRMVTIPKQWNKEHAGQSLGLTVHADAVQAANFKPDFLAESPWGDTKIEVCVHEEDGRVNCVREDVKLSVEYHGDVYKLMSVPDDFFANLPAVMPGDTLEDSIRLSNTTDRKTELFFATGLGKQSKEQLDLLAKVKLEIRMNKKVLYRGDLKAASLNKGVSLGVFSPGAEGRMSFTLSVPKELNNTYALRSAEVKWIFSVNDENGKNRGQEDGNGSGSGSTGSGGAQNRADGAKGGYDSVKTGDESGVEFYMVVLILGILLTGTGIILKRR